MKRNLAYPAAANASQGGFSMLYIVLALVALATLATSLTSLTQTGVSTQLNQNSIVQARYLAMTGYNYVRQFKEDYTDLSGMTFNMGDAGQFQIVQVRKLPTADDNFSVEVLGQANVNTSREANYRLIQPFNSEDPQAITFRDDFDDFYVQTSDPNKQPVVKNPNKTFTIGNNQNYAFGSMYYHGDKELNWGQNVCNFSNSTLAVGCDLKEGFRMFFVSTYATNNADGIVFTFFGTNSTSGLNPYYQTPVEVCSASVCGSAIYAQASVGGESQHGEMIGFAGDGRIYNSSNGSNNCSHNRDVKFWLDPEQNGIQPPKIGVEFDNYPNTDSGDICQDGIDCPARTSQRRDTSGDHVAFVYWGDNNDFQCVHYHYSSPLTLYQDPAGNVSSAIGASTYDDNRHGEGTGDNPPNQITGNRGYWPNGVAGTTPDFTWQNNPFAFRLEVERDVATGEYKLNGWIRRCTDTDTTNGPCREYFDQEYQDTQSTPEDKLHFSDTSRFLCGAGDEASGLCSANNVPDIQQSFTLNAANHEDFRKIIFGFTEATGGAYQTATYSEFILQFVKENDYNASGEKRRVINKTIN